MKNIKNFIEETEYDYAIGLQSIMQMIYFIFLAIMVHKFGFTRFTIFFTLIYFVFFFYVLPRSNKKYLEKYKTIKHDKR